MTKQDQLIPDDPTGADCLRAAVATILDLNIHEVPNFVDDGDKMQDMWPLWYHHVQTWLFDLGYFFFQIGVDSKNPLEPIPYPAYCMLIGQTASGRRHVVVGELGTKIKMIHDPHPGKKGLAVYTDIAFLIPLNPAAMRQHSGNIIEIP